MSVLLAAIGAQEFALPEHLDALHAPGAVGVLFADGTAADPRLEDRLVEMTPATLTG